MPLNQEEIQRYSRHLSIPGIGLQGQEKLKKASVLIIGAGGLGSPIALYLAAAGVGRIGLVDFDEVSLSNLQRQVIHDMEYLGKSKVNSARNRILALNPHIQVDMFEEKFTPQNAERIASDYGLLLDGTDSLYTRYLINDLSYLMGKPYVFGSVYQFEGQASVFNYQDGPCYRCVFSAPPPAETIPKGVQLGVLSPLPGTIGTIQALEAIKLILGDKPTLSGSLLLYDSLSMDFHKIQIGKNPKCPLCGNDPIITDIQPGNPFYSEPTRAEIPANAYITPQHLRQLNAPPTPMMIDVRQPVELQISKLQGAVNIPLAELEGRLKETSKNQHIVLISHKGINRAVRAWQKMKELGYTQVFILKGGLNAWAAEIDPEIRQY